MLADRFEINELSRWRNDEAFSRLLASFLGLLPLRRQSDLLAPAVRKVLLDHSDGVTVRIVRLIEALAIDAIRSGREQIDMESFSVVPSLPLLLSMEVHPTPGFPEGQRTWCQLYCDRILERSSIHGWHEQPPCMASTTPGEAVRTPLGVPHIPPGNLGFRYQTEQTKILARRLHVNDARPH